MEVVCLKASVIYLTSLVEEVEASNQGDLRRERVLCIQSKQPLKIYIMEKLLRLLLTEREYVLSVKVKEAKLVPYQLVVDVKVKV
jgi:hypothetical protein